ncbi:MAG: M12 family metallopeptidase [Bryobacterales bacterium]|nr:M12 family metallopeptidase [Bryobacterales bacterium]
MERQFILLGRLIVILVLALLTRMNFGISLMSQVVLDEDVPRFAYEVVDGLVVFDGDIVLGPVEELASSLQRKPKSRFPFRSQSRVAEPELLWPDRIVPYVVDADIAGEHAEDINWAVEEWNSKTVMTLRPRTIEADYVRFEHAESGQCRSSVGRQGGEQSILLPSYACDADGVAHEIGHAVGLWHEHQRVDRDEYLVYQTEDPNWSSTPKFSPANGPYDYASVMHYSAELCQTEESSSVLISSGRC